MLAERVDVIEYHRHFLADVVSEDAIEHVEALVPAGPVGQLREGHHSSPAGDGRLNRRDPDVEEPVVVGPKPDGQGRPVGTTTTRVGRVRVVVERGRKG